MSKFKVGDKVSDTRTGYCYEVEAVSRGSLLLRAEGGMGWYSDINFELVASAESLLEELVNKANIGQRARDEIACSYPGEAEFEVGGLWYPITRPANKRISYRIKPKPTFEPFFVGPWDVKSDTKPWLVKLNGNAVHVGCLKFNAYELMCCLEDLNKNSVSSAGVSDKRLSAMREGVVCDGTWQISWADSEKIVDALTKIQK